VCVCYYKGCIRARGLDATPAAKVQCQQAIPLSAVAAALFKSHRTEKRAPLFPFFKRNQHMASIIFPYTPCRILADIELVCLRNFYIYKNIRGEGGYKLNCTLRTKRVCRCCRKNNKRKGTMEICTQSKHCTLCGGFHGESIIICKFYTCGK
jgi:hypothetical protein